MRICAVISDTKVLFIDVEELGTIEDIKVLIEVESEIPVSSQSLMHKGKVLVDSTPILESGLLEDDIVQVLTQNNPLRQQALSLLSQANSQPNFLNYLETQNPSLASVVRSGNIDAIEQALMNVLIEQKNHKIEKIQQEVALEADPLNPSAQLEIENRIKQKMIDENLKYAQEYTPEVFGNVEMLYIDCKVNKIPVQAFVDSGAQNTIMSKKCAERLGIMRLVDQRFQGQALGVGVDVIIGRIHAINLEIGGKFFDCCFHVLENAKIDMLFGLDMLKRHQCCIDLHKNALFLNAGEISIPFLDEASIKKEKSEEMKIDEKIKKNETSLEEKNTKIEEKNIKIEEKNTKIEEKNTKIEEKKTKIEEKKTKIDEKKTETAKVQASSIETIYQGKLQKITSLGFTLKEAEEALKIFKGNEELAAAFLFEKHGTF